MVWLDRPAISSLGLGQHLPAVCPADAARTIDHAVDARTEDRAQPGAGCAAVCPVASAGIGGGADSVAGLSSGDGDPVSECQFSAVFIRPAKPAGADYQRPGLFACANLQSADCVVPDSDWAPWPDPGADTGQRLCGPLPLARLAAARAGGHLPHV